MTEIYGNKTGLSPAAVRTLERIYRRRVPIEHLTTPELVRSLVDASVETGRQVGALVHRSGQVDYVVVGDAGQLMLPDIGRLRAAEGRFRGLRLIHTHVRGEALSRDDLVDLVRLRLDLVAAIQLAPGGDPRSIMYAHNVPGNPPYREVGPLPLSRVDVHVGQLMADLEREFSTLSGTRAVRAKDGRAILVHVFDKSRSPGGAAAADVSMRELRELTYTAGVEVADSIVQGREHIDPKFVVGRGKLDDIILRAVELDADVLVFDRNLTPAQASAIAKTSDLKVIDRTQLILDIFAQRAEGRDGKLQVELAQLKYSLQRLGQKDDSLSRLTGGIGGRGPGETKLEIGRRRAKERVTHLEHQLKQLAKQREQRRRKRTREGIPIVAIVGYTNAGKSTLLNTMTGADVLAEDKLFATLDTRSRILKVGWAGYGDREVVLTDTVGFIRDLPKDLFAAFRATFEETADADVLLHVVDASDPDREGHIQTTENLLAELELAGIPRILVYNKADLLEPINAKAMLRGARLHEESEVVMVSATQRETTLPLIESIARKLEGRWDASAKGGWANAPASVPEEPEAGEGGAPAEDGTELFESSHQASLHEMLTAAGKRTRRVSVSS